MLNNIARRYKQMIILAVAAAAIAAYIIPFNSGSVIPTQATSLYEDLIEGLDADQARTNERLQEVIDANPDQEDRVRDRQALSDERYDIARDHVADRTGGSSQSNLEANDAGTEGAGSSTESLESTEADGGQDTSDPGNGNNNADNGRSDRTSNR